MIRLRATFLGSPVYVIGMWWDITDQKLYFVCVDEAGGQAQIADKEDLIFDPIS